MLDAVTLTLHPNETPFLLVQGPHNGRWIQSIWVYRDDVLYEHVTDCGPESDYDGIPPEHLMGDGETTVAEFLFEAERHRNDRDSMPKRHLERVKAESTLYSDIARQIEERREYIANRTVSGPYQTTQRTIYNRENTWRKVRDKVAERTKRRTFYPL